ncbi:MAG TPA: type II toxin-antitoxin system Phd/YefM family antitoxin [Bryobacteraceae bacterium]|nr:type II toxin-antitoxin system Phd/YefM family antitoxin [Bryobacteraceae bacterium]
MSGVWQLADAKNRFSEVVNRALSEGPQRVTRRNDEVVVLSARDYEKLAGRRPSFKQYLMKTGSGLHELDLKRGRSPIRDVRL